MVFQLRGIRDNVRTDVQDEIQATNRRGVPASVAGTKDPEGGHPVRWNAIDSWQAVTIGISRREGFLGDISALSGSMGKRRRFLEKSPHENILNIIDDLPKEIEEIAFDRRFRLSPDQSL